jgi:hypothetical protein
LVGWWWTRELLTCQGWWWCYELSHRIEKPFSTS